MSELRETGDATGNDDPMGELFAFPGSGQTRRPAAWGLATQQSGRESTTGRKATGRKAVVQIGELATVCVITEVPSVGDVIHGNSSAVVESVRITRDGIVRVVAGPANPPDLLEGA